MSSKYDLLFGNDENSDSEYDIGPKMRNITSSSLIISTLGDNFSYEKNIYSKYKFPIYEIFAKNFKHLKNITFPHEIEKGKYEYKVKLNKNGECRFEHLVTQLKWRLEEGKNEAIYEVGVSDGGRLIGLSKDEIHSSIEYVSRMANAVDASISWCRIMQSFICKNVDSQRWIVEICIRPIPLNIDMTNIRVFFLGGLSVGKTTLIGVLTKGEPDDGNGSSRVGLFNHLHEIKSGHTSSISYEMIGFDSSNNVLNYKNRDGKSEICADSSIIITLIDSCGSPKYVDTTVFGLTCNLPHCILQVIDPSKCSHIDESSEWLLTLLLHWNVPSIICLSNIDSCKPSDVHQMYNCISALISSKSSKVAKLVSSLADFQINESLFIDNKIIPIIPYSSVTCENIKTILCFLSIIPSETVVIDKEEAKVIQPIEFQINCVHNIPITGLVVSGILLSGCLKEGDKLLLGPVEENKGFVQVDVHSLRRYHTRCKAVLPGQLASVAIKCPENLNIDIKKGSYLLLKNQPNFSMNVIAKMHIKFMPNSMNGVTGILYIGNFYNAAVLYFFEYAETTDAQDNAKIVKFTLIKKAHYVKNGLKLVFKCGNHKMIGEVLNTM